MHDPPTPTHAKSITRPAVLLFLGLSVIYHSNLRPVASGDSLPASLIPFSILLDGSISLDRFGPYVVEHVPYGSSVVQKTGGHWYSVFPIAGPILATPLYVPILLVPRLGALPPGSLIVIARISEKVVAVALAAAAAVALLLLLRRLTSERSAWMLALLFALGTGNWSTSSQALWQHTFGVLPIVGCLYSIERFSDPGSSQRWYWMAGICSALAVAVRPTNLAMIPALALALVFGPFRLSYFLRVFAPPAAAAALVAAYNYAAFHKVIGGYPYLLIGHLSSGLLGILISPGRGLLIYTPVAAVALVVFTARARASVLKHRPLAAAAGTFALCQVVFIALWPMWWGGHCWGPRLLTEILPPIIILIAIGLPAIRPGFFRAAFVAAALYGCFIQAVGVYCYPKGRWDSTPVTIYEDPGRLWNWADNPVNRTLRGGFAWEPYVIVTTAVSDGIPAAARKLEEFGINPY